MTWLLFLIGVGHLNLLFGQELRLINEFEVDEPQSASLDRKGSLFIAERSGIINKYGSGGEIDLTYSASRNSKITLLEAWSTLDVLVFYGGYQSVTILNRFLSPITEVSLQDKIGFARLATFSGESNLWVIDDSDFSLKLLDLSLDLITIVTPFNQILDPDDYDISYIREYQNLLFIVDKNTGILVFDNLGNYLRTIEAKGLTFTGFINDEIYYAIDNELTLVNIYSEEQRTINLPSDGMALVSNDKVYLIGERTVKVFSY